ncbi:MULTISPECIES: electron transport complex subunit RsxC [unclassified Muribaculum]|jgi:electron transport complex protein RnfC|uniref:Ion-translocating oxidoreductase complex subunit C n=1 Tax=Candidatus Merdivivens faecigallinarum TaxID=2840871 RepID=A0A9D9NQ45_9BACT|nr:MULTISPECIES: electron transport complex subunit RsxC [unclassified Muribaculum]MBO8481640.1 electron transport complex subunit RsxC [Candidatus Merdivivens faecigallinarum]
MRKRTFSIGGVHPDDHKIARDCAIEDLPLAPLFSVSMAQHLGAPATPAVAVGDKVKVGQVIGEPSGFISAYVHSPVSGTVKAVAPKANLLGNMVVHVDIEVEGDEWMEDIDRTGDIVREITLDREQILERIRKCGVVGLGGATFPTHVKLSPPPGKKADILILNGAECEPYLTSDYRIMLERGEEIVIGAEIMKLVLGVPRVVIGIEENKPEAIENLGKIVRSHEGIEVMALKKRYPQGGEKQLINAVTGRQVPSMALPIDAGAVVQNVGTSLAVYEAVQKNKPLIDNVLTVTGECCPRQRNLRVRVGTPLSFILEQSGGIPENAVKIISGGPMMGWAVSNIEATTVKSTSSLLCLTAEQTMRKEEGNCIRCGKCVDACPMGLEPYLLNRLARARKLDELEQNAVYDCIECGCCLYSCPAHIPLLDTIRVYKREVLGIMKSRAAAAK